MSIPGPIDFEPDPCSATALMNCLALKECKLPSISLPSLSASGLIGVTIGGLPGVQISINTDQACLLAAVTLAFIAAGCPMPTPPTPPVVPDVQDCLDEMDNFTDYAEEATLGVAEGIVNITYDSNGLPIRVQA